MKLKGSWKQEGTESVQEGSQGNLEIPSLLSVSVYMDVAIEYEFGNEADTEAVRRTIIQQLAEEGIHENEITFEIS